jgi:transposase
MPKKVYHVQLTPQDREGLLKEVNRGHVLARTITHARILLLSDEGKRDKEVTDALKVSQGTVARARKRYCQEGLEAALHDKPRSGAPPKLDSRLEAQLTALACSAPPEGHARWTLRLLADKLVELELVDSVSHTGVRKWLKKTNSSLG